ncbi:progranulin [Amia ocellicauda]|uniref:progranulin n=1 Tax=Amia ocellicauda TaxID=2972642 RepID=UPI00346469BA
MLRASVLVLLVGLASGSVTCPDGRHCPERSTCCPSPSGYQCCPIPKAVCCPDQRHCCPEGYSCNVATMMCERAGEAERVPMLRKTAAIESNHNHSIAAPVGRSCCSARSAAARGSGCDGRRQCQERGPRGEALRGMADGSVIRCDSEHYCPPNNTCCKKPDGVWGCCPFPLAECCKDGVHCCPFSYKCDAFSTGCKRKHWSIPSAHKTDAWGGRNAE